MANAAVRPPMPAPAMMTLRAEAILATGSGGGTLRQRAFRRECRMRIKRWVVAVKCRAVRADDLVGVAHVEEHVRVIERRLLANAHELARADLDHRGAGCIVKVRNDLFRHDAASLPSCRVAAPCPPMSTTVSGEGLAVQDDPVALADHAIAHSFDTTVASREINAALAAEDTDLAQSFVDLAREQNLPLDPALVQRVAHTAEEAASTRRSLESFARGFVTGEPKDSVGLAGTAVGELFVFGDLRDAVREGARFASGQQGDELILGLACVGLAVTAGTYATAGLSAPVRAGLTVIKAARRNGAIGGRMAAAINRALRESVDWGGHDRAAGKLRICTAVASVRGVRDALKMEKTEGLVRLVGDVGRVQSKAG